MYVSSVQTRKAMSLCCLSPTTSLTMLESRVSMGFEGTDHFGESPNFIFTTRQKIWACGCSDGFWKTIVGFAKGWVLSNPTETQLTSMVTAYSVRLHQRDVGSSAVTAD